MKNKPIRVLKAIESTKHWPKYPAYWVAVGSVVLAKIVLTFAIHKGFLT